MKYDQIVEAKRINEIIHHCFQYLDDNEKQKIVRQFKQQPHDKIQAMHTFRELILGAYLSQSGLCVRHNYGIESKTPDWCVLDNNLQPQIIVELLNFHPDAETSADIVNQIQQSGIWANFVKPNAERLYETIRTKVVKYRSLVTKYKIPYVVSIFGESTAFVDQDELDQCLFDKESGIFGLYPEISGVLYFEEASGVYFFSYTPNPKASFSLSIPNGKFE
ncbi:MAG: hypothetical protein ROW48_13840 [Bellilinea sp.]|jgi:hypothetical protein